jgi:hypothetical protein
MSNQGAQAFFITRADIRLDINDPRENIKTPNGDYGYVRFMAHDDVTGICIKYTDGSEDDFVIPWTDDSEDFQDPTGQSKKTFDATKHLPHRVRLMTGRFKKG